MTDHGADRSGGSEGAEGGDPACWADRVCPACGLLDERERRDGRCPHCGAPSEAEQG